MKKSLTLLILCLFTSLVVFGYFNAILSVDEAPKTPLSAWLDAERSLETANERMHQLELDLERYRTERNTLTSSSAAVLTSLADIIKGLLLNKRVVTRLMELDSLIFSVYVQMADLNVELRRLASERDTAYDAYAQTTSQPEEKMNTPDYGDVPECRLACMGGCGTVFSSNDVGHGNLANTALTAHLVYCDDQPHKSAGNCYYSCPPNYPDCPESEDHYVSCVGGCGEQGPPQYSGSFSKKLETIGNHRRRCQAKNRYGSICAELYHQCNGQTSSSCPDAEDHAKDVTGPCGHTYPEYEWEPHRRIAYSCNIHDVYRCMSSEEKRALAELHTRRIRFACMVHTGKCQAEAQNHRQQPCPVKDGKTCSHGTYYPCLAHTHDYSSSNDDDDDTSDDSSNNNIVQPPDDSVIPPPAPNTATCAGCGEGYEPNNPGRHIASSCGQTGPNGESCTNDYYDCVGAQHQHSW